MLDQAVQSVQNASATGVDLDAYAAEEKPVQPITFVLSPLVTISSSLLPSPTE